LAIIRGRKDGAASDKDIGTRRGNTTDIVGLDAAIDFDLDLEAALFDALAQRVILARVAGMKLWPPKPGLTLISSTRSRSSRMTSRVVTGVAGLIDTPAFLPRLLIS